MAMVRRGARVVAAGVTAVVVAGLGASVAMAEVAALPPVLATTVSTPTASVSGQPAAATPIGDTVSYGGGDLQAVSPTRVLDTRVGLGAPRARLGASRTLALKVTGVGGVPGTGVGAVVLNVTGVSPTTSTYLTVWPGGAARPTASSLNLARGLTAPNLVVAKVGRGGVVNIGNRAGSLDVLADVTGWFPEASGLQPVVPARVLDTRTGLGAPKATVGARRSLTVQLAGRGGLPTTGVAAVVVNLTGVTPTRSTYVTAWPAGAARPGASTLNVDRSAVTSNLAVVKVGAGGRIALHNNAGSLDLVADVVAWFPSSAAYTAVGPARILDTRTGLGAPAAVGPRQQVAVQVTGRGGVPTTGVGAIVLNLTGILPTRSTYVTAWPAGIPRPTASTLNLGPGAVRANLVMAKVGTGGRVLLYNNSGTTHLAGDVVGWFPTGTDTSVTMDPTAGTTLHGSGDLLAWTGDAGAGGTVTFAASSDLPAVGGHFAFQGGPASGPGVSGLVTGITTRPDGSAVATYVPANLQDLFTQLDVHSTGAVLAAAASSAHGPSGTASTTTAQDDGCENDGGVAVALPTATFKDLNGSADFSLGDGTARFVVNGSLELKWAIAVEAGVACTVTLAKGTLMWIGWTEIGWELKAGLSISGKLEARTTVTMPVRVGFIHADGTTTNLSNLDINGTASDDAELAASITASLTGALTTKLFGVLGVSGAIEPSISATWTPAEPLGCVELKGGLAVSLAAEAGRWGLTWEWTLAEVALLEQTLYSSPGCSPGHWVGTVDVAHDAVSILDDGTGTVTARWIDNITGSYRNLELRLDSGGRQSYSADVTASVASQTYYRCPLDALSLTFSSTWSYSGSSTATESRGQPLTWYRGTAFELWNRPDGTYFMPYHVVFNDGVGQYHCPVATEPGLAGGSGLGYDVASMWEPTSPLPDTDPAPAHLVGTTTLREPPGGGGRNYTSYSYRITYDLTFVPSTP